MKNKKQDIDNLNTKELLWWICIFLLGVCLATLVCFMSSCTISMEIHNSMGRSSDSMSDSQSASADLESEVSLTR